MKHLRIKIRKVILVILIVESVPIEDPSKKFIQMNLPNNFKKQLRQNKEKKEINLKQNNIVNI
jgi:hypothetical protein